VLIVQDIHQVIGRRELDFESACREMASALNSDQARFLWFAWAPHGAGEGYEAVTLISVPDAEALDHLQERIRDGDLSERWTSIEGMRYGLESSTHVLESPSPTNTEGDREPALFRLDHLALSQPLRLARGKISTALAELTEEGTLEVAGWWTPLLGDLESPSVVVLNRIRSDAALLEAFADPAKPWSGALESAFVVGRNSRLLRTARWSPWT